MADKNATLVRDPETPNSVAPSNLVAHTSDRRSRSKIALLEIKLGSWTKLKPLKTTGWYIKKNWISLKIRQFRIYYFILASSRRAHPNIKFEANTIKKNFLQIKQVSFTWDYVKSNIIPLLRATVSLPQMHTRSRLVFTKKIALWNLLCLKLCTRDIM